MKQMAPDEVTHNEFHFFPRPTPYGTVSNHETTTIFILLKTQKTKTTLSEEFHVILTKKRTFLLKTIPQKQISSFDIKLISVIFLILVYKKTMYLE